MSVLNRQSSAKTIRPKPVLILCIIVAGLWMWLYEPLFSYFGVIFGRNDFRTNQLLLILISALVGHHAYTNRNSIQLSAQPHLNPSALWMALGGSSAFILVERFIGVHTLSASLFAFATYGLIGLWLPKQTWRRGLLAALLIVGTLPFGMFLQTFIGYPMRILTAKFVQMGFTLLGIESVGVDTILILGNGVANIDLPCSGVQSLWTGGLFLMGATWVEKRKINLRWLLIVAFMVGMLFIVNLLRVAALTYTGPVLGWWDFANIIHVPLGVLGFIVACGATLLLLRTQPINQPDSILIENGGARPAWLLPLLIVWVIGLKLAYAPHTLPTTQSSPIQWQFANALTVTPDPLDQRAHDWLLNDGAEAADRFTFSYNNLSGSLLLVPSTTWRAHHNPERCFEVNGETLQTIDTVLVNAHFPLRSVGLDGTEQSAAYWFQSAEKTTDDYIVRIWDDVALERDRWVLVAVLFDQTVNHDSAELTTFYENLHLQIAQELTQRQTATIQHSAPSTKHSTPNSEHKPMTEITQTPPEKKLKRFQRLRNFASIRIWGHIFFWGWNLAFLSFLLFGFAPHILPPLVTAVLENLIPARFFFYGVLLFAIPIITTFVGFRSFRQWPDKLFALLFGVEFPLMMLVMMRFFAIKQVPAQLGLVMALGLLGIGVFTWQQFDPRIDKRGRKLTILRMIGLTGLLLVGLFVASWLLFYIVPISAVILAEIWWEITHFSLKAFLAGVEDFIWEILNEAVFWAPFFILWMSLLFATMLVLALQPIFMTILYFRGWLRGVQGVLLKHGRRLSLGVSAIVIVLVTASYLHFADQPQDEAYALLKEAPTSIQEAEALTKQEDLIRDGLVNAYLASYRYGSISGEVKHIENMYVDAFGLTDAQASRVADWYNVIAGPTLYQPMDASLFPSTSWNRQNFAVEADLASNLYQTYFDKPINEGELDTIEDAVQATFNPDLAMEQWQAVDEREVHLDHQEVTITEHGDWAEVELYEIYSNETGMNEEVVYYFNLPESAVLTGVWLGNSPDLDNRFEYRVAPRGAAQEVYQRQVTRNIDPALLEQLGPRQYRLRVFPIMPKNDRWDSETNRMTVQDGASMHMWLTYSVMAAEEGWAMPQIAEKRNLFWTTKTERILNGSEMDVDGDVWLPEFQPMWTTFAPEIHRFDFGNGQSLVVSPERFDGKLPSNLTIAAVLDRSYSMADMDDEVEAAFEMLGDLSAEIDVYLTAADNRGEAASVLALNQFDADDVFYFGGQNPGQLIRQFDQLRDSAEYDAIFIITDDSGYELGEVEGEVPRPDSPVWMVHLNGLPLGYDDATLEAIQASGGGSTTDLAEAIERLALSLTTNPGERDIVDGYDWELMPTSAAPSTPSDPDFAPLAARRLILSEMVKSRGDLNNVEALDELHVLAVENSIVTPYSSMIVLVNDAQHRLLDDLENDADRFDREVETVGETTLTGVPEPEEWVLIILSIGLFGYYIRHNRRSQQGAMAV